MKWGIKTENYAPSANAKNNSSNDKHQIKVATRVAQFLQPVFLPVSADEV
jgi:hypothetical protein